MVLFRISFSFVSTEVSAVCTEVSLIWNACLFCFVSFKVFPVFVNYYFLLFTLICSFFVCFKVFLRSLYLIVHLRKRDINQFEITSP